jgi:ABC-type antimicrobial peptide transport system permease subunit
MLGKEITLPGEDEPPTVVGVVGDVRNLGPLREVLPQVFRPSRQHGRTLTTLVVRSDVPDATSSLPAVREVLHDVAPDIPVYDVMALSAVVRESTALQRRAFAVVGIFSLIATILAGTGVFAALNHFVAIRRREMGIRAALGAGGGRLARLIFARASALTILGGTLGTVMTFVVLRFVSASQFGVLAPAAWDYAAGVLIILGVAAVACVPAALQAARVNPVALLRSER